MPREDDNKTIQREALPPVLHNRLAEPSRALRVGPKENSNDPIHFRRNTFEIGLRRGFCLFLPLPLKASFQVHDLGRPELTFVKKASHPGIVGVDQGAHFLNAKIF